jgi:hypothetical protein
MTNLSGVKMDLSWPGKVRQRRMDSLNDKQSACSKLNMSELQKPVACHPERKHKLAIGEGSTLQNPLTKINIPPYRSNTMHTLCDVAFLINFGPLA